MIKLIEEHKSPILEPEDISEAVLYVLGTPPRVQVSISLILRICDYSNVLS
jgi:NADP-dependent 3-hydroxy acid dehydrogenase YdfG